MMVMTAKVNLKKVMIALAAVVLGLIEWRWLSRPKRPSGEDQEG